jgi:hypothetical protein
MSRGGAAACCQAVKLLGNVSRYVAYEKAPLAGLKQSYVLDFIVAGAPGFEPRQAESEILRIDAESILFLKV